LAGYGFYRLHSTLLAALSPEPKQQLAPLQLIVQFQDSDPKMQPVL
jgi:hypothetical protein